MNAEHLRCKWCFKPIAPAVGTCKHCGEYQPAAELDSENDAA